VKIAITGGTGFVGRNIARTLTEQGHQVVLLARGLDATDPAIRNGSNAHFIPLGLENVAELVNTFANCATVVHCAGINREIGSQTFQRVHVDGTRNVVTAAQKAGVCKIILISFLRARPNCGSAYHESKWAAEEIVRGCGLDYTIFKCGVIYGKGDHMLDHLSHAFYTFPLFAFVGFHDQSIRPAAIEDVARIASHSATTTALSRQTAAVLGPEELTLRQAVRRVAKVIGKKPLMFPLPLSFHYTLGWCIEKIMRVPMVSVAQVRMLAEGISVPLSGCPTLPGELAPRIRFTEDQIRKGLPPPGRFGLRDIRCCGRGLKKNRLAIRRVFLETP